MKKSQMPDASTTFLRKAVKHYSEGNNGYEYCSGRMGWSNKLTADKAKVTCGNCLRQLGAA